MSGEHPAGSGDPANERQTPADSGAAGREAPSGARARPRVAAAHLDAERPGRPKARTGAGRWSVPERPEPTRRSAPPSVRLPAPLVPVAIAARLNRFTVAARDPATGRRLRLHLPNSGRLTELLVPGARGLFHRARDPGRGTAGTLYLVRHRRRWVGVDAGMPNRLFEALLRVGAAGGQVRRWRREARRGSARIDFLVETPAGPWLVETKSCNKVVGDTALFPDAPTARGARHLRALARAARRGMRASVIWFVQRSDARRLRPDAGADPAFAQALRQARAAGVELRAYACRVTPRRLAVLRRIPVELG